MSDPVFLSPLHHRQDEAARANLAVSMTEIADRGAIDLRGLLSDDAFTAAVRDVLGLALPATPRTSEHHEAVTALWLSTDQWLILVPRAEAPALTAALTTRLAGIHSLACDVSDMRCIIRLEGNGAREILMKGCSLNLLGDDIQPGFVKRVLFAEIGALVRVVAIDPDSIELYVFRSYAEYAWEWLLKTGRETARLKLFGEQIAPAL